MTAVLPLDLAMAALLSWLGLGLLGFALGGYQTPACRAVFPLSTMGGLLLAAAGLWALTATPDVLQISGPFPVLPWSFRLDPLSGFFLILLGLLAAAVSVFATGYFQPLPAAALRRLFLQYQGFLLGMGLVLLADNAYTFLVAWEIMAIASYFLVVTEHEEEGSRRAGFLYLLIAHLGALAILLGFAVLAGVQILQGGSFSAMMQAQLSPFWASAAFLLTFFGFGAKAGLLPLHIWLPEAHPAAPAPVSALMSGAMLQTAFYGMLRVDFLFLPQAAEWWGPFVLLVGLASALFAVLFAAAQTDMKRLLAYSSMENMGLIMVAMGLALIFRAHGLDALAALALIAALYHALNHAFFKGLLFLGSGSVLHAAGTVAMDRLGGLIQRMPQTAFFMLVGVLAIAGLPPLNGFVSEWLLLQAFLLAPALPQSTLSAVLPLAASGVVLSAALAAYAMVKFYGISFLGQPRAHLPVHETGRWERSAMGLLAMACVALGLFPGVLIGLLDPVIREMVGQGLGQQGWLWLTPVSAQRASYSPVIFLFGIALALGVAFVLVWWRFGRPLRRAGVWACGFPLRTARMQDSPLGFVEPLLRIFRPVFQLRREALSTAAPRLSLQLGEPVTAYLYRPLAATAAWLSAQMVRLQQGRITVYLLYSFLTLLLLLALLR
ncbi:MAG: hydrogenase 4 subunit B [Gammaproteobacteria bacterium]|nr:hydrogenase 4 subunit B [Gammaproteobacteria bacterium]